MATPVEEIKHRLDLVEVIKRYVKLKKAGQSYKGLCPFHNEKTPSFTVSPDKQMWYCFGCSEGGDLFTFVQKIENLEFPDALRQLAHQAGVEIKKEDPAVRSQRNTLHEMLQLSTQFFVRQLQSRTGKKVVEYLKERGVSMQSITDWQLGYAPDQWRGLYSFLQERGYSDANIEAAGLAIHSESEKAKHPYHDRFRHRIMFPLRNTQGEVIGFAGRVFDGVSGSTVGDKAGSSTTFKPGKYINTPNTLVYDKSRILYGLDRARKHIKKEAVIVEGNLDVILAHQAGGANVVAVSGTALASDHLQILSRYTKKLLLCFDADDAGERAARKAAQLALAKEIDVAIVSLPKGEDAADVLVRSKDEWDTALSQAKPYVQLVLDAEAARYDTETLEGKKAVTREVLIAISHLASPLEQEHWVGELALAVGTTEEALMRELKRRTGKKETSSYYQPQKDKQSSSGSVDKKKTGPLGTQLEEYLLALLVYYPEGVAQIEKKDLKNIESERVRAMLEKIVGGANPVDLLAGDEQFASVQVLAGLLPELIRDEKEEITAVRQYLARRTLRKKLQTVQTAIKKAEQEENTEKVEALVADFTKLSKELASFNN